MIDDHTRQRIRNWARWSLSGRGTAAHCYSAEGRYMPELLRGDALTDRRTPDDPIDVRDALEVWRAINPTSGFPVRWHLALSARFIFRLDGWQFAGYMRRHHVPVGRSTDEHDRLVEQALHAARNVLERNDLARASRSRYDSAVPPGHRHDPRKRG